MSADGARAEGWEAPPGTVGCRGQTPRVWPWVCWHEVPKGPRLPIGTRGHAHPSARNPHSLRACSLRIPRFCPGCLSWQLLGGSQGSAFSMCPQVVAGTMAGETTGLHYCIDYALPWSKQSSFFLAGGGGGEGQRSPPEEGVIIYAPSSTFSAHASCAVTSATLLL